MAIYSSKSLGKIQDGIDNGTVFKAASVSGDAYTFHSVGRLPEPWATAYRSAQARETLAYTVRSYDTPIAWKLTSGEWVMPDESYSATTSGHQGRVRVAIANPGFYSADRRTTHDRAVELSYRAPSANGSVFPHESLQVSDLAFDVHRHEVAPDGMFPDPYAHARAQGFEL